MATETVVAAYYLGNTGSDGGKAGQPAVATVVTFEDIAMDGTISEGEDTINGFTVSSMKDQSTIELENSLTVNGWYVEHEDASGDKEIYFVPTDSTVPTDSVLAEDSEQNGDQEGDTGDLTPLPPPPCFVAGTNINILTSSGYRPVESLKTGEKIQTKDNGFQNILWIGKARLTQQTLRRAWFARPVKIAKGSFGDGLPTADLYLSPMHRVLTSGPKINLLFAEDEAFAAAKFFLPLSGVSQRNPRHVEYYHLLFDNHEVIQSEGVWTESLYLGQNGFGGFDHDQRLELCCLFPELLNNRNVESMKLARRDLRRFETHAAL